VFGVLVEQVEMFGLLSAKVDKECELILKELGRVGVPEHT